MRWLLLVTCLFWAASCNCGQPGNGGTGGGGGTNAGGGSGGGTGGAGGGAQACIAGATALAISPADSTVSGGAPVNFTAQATTGSGTVDATSQVTWSASRTDDTPPGSISGAGVYTPTAGGVVTITATDGCLTATTTLTIKLDATFGTCDATCQGRFGGTVVTGDATHGPKIVYPNDQTRFPRNIYKVLFQWRKQGNDFFRLTFDGPYSKTVVFTDGAHPNCAAATPPAGCYESDLKAWLSIAGSNAGAVTTLTIDGVATGDANVYRSASIQLGFSKRDVRGAIFYWSTTAQGIRRASVSDFAPEAYVVAKPVATVLPAPGGTVQCVACHTVSRSGKKIIAFTQSSASTGEYTYDVTLQPPPTPLLTTQLATARAFGTFSPDDQNVVVTVGNKLTQFNANTGAKIVDLPGVPAGTNPDWSPSGTLLAYSNLGGDSPGKASLNVIAYDGGWGAVRTLVASDGGTNLFPSFSPDGQLIAYASGRKGGHGDVTLQLFLVPADGSGPPVELLNANRDVNNTVTLGQYENNMPTWAPPGDLDWVAFNSLRPYGVVYPNGGTQQIWVAAIDRSKGTVDPSYPAFRFAFQDLGENNHRAFWTLDVRQPADGGVCSNAGSECIPGGAPCCAGLSCLATSEVTYACGVPTDAGSVDAGSCLALDQACSQTSGASCCSPNICDLGADGGTVCKGISVQ